MSRCGATVGVSDHGPAAWYALKDTCRMRVHCTRFVRYVRRWWHWSVRPDLSSSDVRGVDERGRRRSGDSLRPLVLRIAIFLLVGRFLGRRARRLNDNEFLLDDVYTVTTADRVGEVYKSLNKHLWDFSRIRVNRGKTQERD